MVETSGHSNRRSIHLRRTSNQRKWTLGIHDRASLSSPCVYRAPSSSCVCHGRRWKTGGGFRWSWRPAVKLERTRERGYGREEESRTSSLTKVSTIPNCENLLQDEHFYVFVAHPVVKVEFHVKDNDAFGAELMEVVEIPVANIVFGDMVNDWFSIIGNSGSPPCPTRNFTSQPNLGRSATTPYTRMVLGLGQTMWVYHTHIFHLGKIYEQGKCREDICHAILEAHHLIYIIGWSIYHPVRLVREPSREFPNGGELSLGELLKYKSEEGVRVVVLIWDDKTSRDKFLLKTDGVTQTHDEETKKFFRHCGVRCVLALGYASTKLSIFKQQVFRSIDLGSVKGFPKSVEEAAKQNLICGKNLKIDKSIHTARRFKSFTVIYVHAKGMIVDDEYVTMGSANISQRSLHGSRDIEIAMGGHQPHHTWAGKKRHLHGQVYGYRMSLWAEHLGDLEDSFREPQSIECVKRVNRIAKRNWKAYVDEDQHNPKEMGGHLMQYPIQVILG
ncbi:hypothetical protein NL676_039555 [Syzygium grande]|nr:hypothetical protein NL676_039555 [Syzygium grande]